MSIEERPTTPTRLSRTWRVLTLLLAGVLCLLLACSPAPTYYEGGPPGREPTGLELFLFLALVFGVPLVWFFVRQMQQEAENRERIERRREERDAGREKREQARQRMREILPDHRIGEILTVEELQAMTPKDRAIALQAEMARWDDFKRTLPSLGGLPEASGENQADRGADAGKPDSGPQGGGEFSI